MNAFAPQVRHSRARGNTSPALTVKTGYVYIMASGHNGTLYLGVTSDLERRIGEHRLVEAKGFTQRYRVKVLVYYEALDGMDAAIAREKQLKKWRRKWKLDLIEMMNPNWNDLAVTLLGMPPLPGATGLDPRVRGDDS